MAAKGVLGGLQPDPDKGKPYRRTREKARLMISSLNEEQLHGALLYLMDTRPEDLLDALLHVNGEE